MADGSIPVVGGVPLDVDQETRPDGTVVAVERVALRAEGDPRGTLTPPVEAQGVVPVLMAILAELRAIRSLVEEDQLDALDGIDRELEGIESTADDDEDSSLSPEDLEEVL